MREVSTKPVPPLAPARHQVVKVPLPKFLVERGLALSDRIRNRGLHIEAGSGSGKSTLEALIALKDFSRGVPTVIFDPNGATIDYFLGGLARRVARLAWTGQLSPEDQQKLWQRVRYVDMSGKNGYITPFPLYYRLGDESPKDIASRFLEVLLRLDPQLKEAPIQGWNALAKLGSRAGIILAALRGQITEAHSLLNHWESWQARLHDLGNQTTDPGVREAVDFFTKVYPTKWKDQDRERAKSSLETKLDLFTQDERMRAMFGAAEVGIAWQEVIERGQTVLLDFRHEQNEEARRFKMLWVFRSFLDYIKARGRASGPPVSLIIDELTSLYNFDIRAGADIFASDLDELINQIARDFNVWLTLAHQEAFQIAKTSHKTLMSMGTQILGVTSDWESAEARVKRFCKYDPYRIKRWSHSWVSSMLYIQRLAVDPVEYTVEEQDRLATELFTWLGQFEFLIKMEGDRRGVLIPVTIANQAKEFWADQAFVAKLRQRLAQRDGIPLQKVLEEIDTRQDRLTKRSQASFPQQKGNKQQVKPAAGRATLTYREGYQDDEDDDDLSPAEFGEKRTAEDA